LIPNTNNIRATIKPVTLLSQIADQDFENHTLLASSNFFPTFNSSLILSKMRIFASIAIPILKIKPAIEARVSVIQNDLITVSTKITYENNAIDAIKPESLYTESKNTKIMKKPDTHAKISLLRELAPSFGSIAFSEVR
jgi:hypothetical protein